MAAIKPHEILHSVTNTQISYISSCVHPMATNILRPFETRFPPLIVVVLA